MRKFVKSRKFIAIAVFIAVGAAACGSAVAATQDRGLITPQECVAKMKSNKKFHLHRGNVNNDKQCVRYVQRMLTKQGYGLSADGNYGSGTESAVSKYQSKKGLARDGRAGPNTFSALLNDYNAPVAYLM